MSEFERLILELAEADADAPALPQDRPTVPCTLPDELASTLPCGAEGAPSYEDYASWARDASDWAAGE